MNSLISVPYKVFSCIDPILSGAGLPLAYELSDMDMSILGQEPVSRDWQGITNVSDPDHDGETSEEEKCLPSIYNLQTYNSHKV